MLRHTIVGLQFNRARSIVVKRWAEFWREPDALLRDQAGTGELTVARIRFVLIAALSIIPFSDFRDNPVTGWAAMGITAALAALLIWYGVYQLTKRSAYQPWIGFVSSAVDVTFVTFVLMGFLLADRPLVAVNSRVVFGVYFIAIAATDLRYDPRICVFTGLLAIAQYAGLVAFAQTNWVLDSGQFVASDGDFDLASHYARLVLLGAATVFAVTAVVRIHRLRWVSAKDPLTGLMNRGAFDEWAEVEVSRTLRYKRTLAIALMDVDHFKRFNDTFGHLVGDEVLRVISGMLEQSVRKTDLVARYGGEEFVMMFPETEVGPALAKIEEVRETIQASSVTVSIGLASIPHDGTDLRTVIDRADKRLYEAKENGRNQVVGPEILDE